MHKAAEGGHLGVIKFLSRKFGASVHEKDGNGYTLLHWAAKEGHCEVARYLIEEVKMEPRERSKVCGMQRGDIVFKVYTKCTCCNK